MKKIKTFIKEHRSEIIASLFVAGAVTVAFYTGKKSGKNEIFDALDTNDIAFISMPINDIDVKMIISNDILKQFEK